MPADPTSDSAQESKGLRRSNSAIGISVVGSSAAGIVAMLATIPAWFAADWVGVGVLTGAAGIAFGLLANALLRR
jgi:hypothetical protein